MLDGIDLDGLCRSAEAQGLRCVVGAAIFDSCGRALIVRRSEESSILPGIWDLVGSHVESDESMLDTLEREVYEETGWPLPAPATLSFVGDWSTTGADGQTIRRREFDFVVRVPDDRVCPSLAPDEHSEFRWITRDDIGVLDENANTDGGMIRRILEGAWHGPVTDRRRPHVTAFFDPQAIEPIEAIRRRWDPAMAAQIRAHVTVAYPSELHDVQNIGIQLAELATGLEPIRLQLGSPHHAGDPTNGIALAVDDPGGTTGWLRRHLVSSEPPWPPHVTLVHPRTSGLGQPAWQELDSEHFATEALLTELAITDLVEGHWTSIETISLL